MTLLLRMDSFQTILSPNSTSHDTEESENSPESPHLGEIKHMRKQRVPGASPFFACAEDEATSLRKVDKVYQYVVTPIRLLWESKFSVYT